MRLATRAPLEISAARRRFDRILWLLLALACVAGVIVYAPRLSSAYHAWSLSRLSPTRLEAHVRKHPNDLEARYRLGLSLGRSGKHVEAIRELVAVLQKDPGRADVLNDLGALYLLEGRYYESLVTLRAALEARPEYAVVYANLGRLHVATKMPFTAVKELAHAVHLAPGNVETLCDLGEAYQRTLNYTSARRVYEQVLNKEPRLVRAHVGLGKTLFSLTEYGMAEAALQRALQLAAEEPTALATLGRLKLEQAAEEAEFQTARDLLRRAVRADPADSDAWYDLGRVALRQKKPDQAVPFLERALQLSGRHPGATLQLSQALRLVGRTAEADRWTER
ncbi:MAG: tetratricopeptide repeat protein, partial [Armatimonadetes bacterium]|nr:tetratricopeptide repeat protein [Armatimonadota bacterium]